MLRDRRLFLTGALLALALAGCGAPTAAPTSTAATPPGPATDTPAPTAPMPAEPLPPETVTLSPTASPTSASRLLPDAVPWVRLGDRVYALGGSGQQLDLSAGGRFDPAFTATADGQGGWVAFSDAASMPRRLVVISAADGSVRELPAGDAGEATEGRFSPDGRSIAYVVIGEGTWELRAADLQSAGERMLAQGATTWQEGEPPPLLPLPIEWTQAGLLAQEVLWATDAPPQAVTRYDPTSGEATRVEIEHLGAYPSPDGTRVALVTGVAPIGGAPRQGVRVLDLASGSARELLPEQEGLIKALRWSPDGGRLLAATSPSYDSPLTTVRALSLDGGPPQAVDFGGGGSGPALHDIAWADDSTPLVLLANQATGQAELHALPLGSFDASALRLVGEIPLPEDHAAPIQILYVPR